MDGDALRGHLEFLLLASLAETEGHGYALIERLRLKSDGALQLGEGSVYPALHRLESAGLVASRWDRASGRRKRVYRLTAVGRKRLGQQRRDWDALVKTVGLVIGAS
jgi:DNA-binding PadR family transcriptional regulator